MSDIIIDGVIDITVTVDYTEKGDRGFSAYEVAVQQGFIGTLQDWLLSLKQPVTSVNGRIGDITGLAEQQSLTEEAFRAQTEENKKANISGQVFTGNITAPNLSGVNTGDQDLSSYARGFQIEQLDENKVDKEAGKSLITDAERANLTNQSGVNTGDQDLSGKANVIDVTTEVSRAQLAESQLQTNINLNATLFKRLTPVAGSALITDAGLVGSFPKFVALNGQVYTVSSVAASVTPKVVKFDISTGLFTFPANLSASDEVGTLYSQSGDPAIIPATLVSSVDFLAVKSYIDNYVKLILTSNLNADYVYSVTDIVDTLLLYVLKNGAFGAAKWDDKNIPGTALKDSTITLSKVAADVLAYFLRPADLLPYADLKTYIETFVKPVLLDNGDNGWAFPIVDVNDRLLGGFDLDGFWTALKYKAATIHGNALKDGTVDTAQLSANVKAAFWQPLDPATGYVAAIIDSEDRKLLMVTTDGTIEIGKLQIVGSFNYTIPINTVSMLMLTQDLQDKILSGGTSNLIVFWGDSLTAGAGGGGVTAATTVQALAGSKYVCYNGGVGGENVSTIAARQGGVPALTLEEFTLPADTSYVEISSVPNMRLKNSKYAGAINWLKQGGNGQVNPCFVQDVECTIRWVADSTTDPLGKWEIKRNVAGISPRTIIVGTPIITGASLKYRKAAILVIEIGQNGGYADLNLEAPVNTPEILIDYYKKMIEFTGCTQYLCVGMHTGTPSSRAATEKAFDEAFGSRYINTREYISKYALDDMGVTPTAEDILARNNGTFPPSFWNSPTDSVHGNALFYTAKGIIIYKRMLQLGYLTI